MRCFPFNAAATDLAGPEMLVGESSRAFPLPG